MQARGKGRTLNTRLSQTVRGAIVTHLRHQAAAHGIAVVIVPPRGTSKYCPHCLTAFRHHKAPNKRAAGWAWATCPNTACGYSTGRDNAAWQRIGARGLTHQHKTSLDRTAGNLRDPQRGRGPGPGEHGPAADPGPHQERPHSKRPVPGKRRRVPAPPGHRTPPGRGRVASVRRGGPPRARPTAASGVHGSRDRTRSAPPHGHTGRTGPDSGQASTATPTPPPPGDGRGRVTLPRDPEHPGSPRKPKPIRDALPSMPTLPQQPPAEPSGPNMVVCGDDALAHRLAAELRDVYGERVTLVIPSAREPHSPRTRRRPARGRAAALFGRVSAAMTRTPPGCRPGARRRRGTAGGDRTAPGGGGAGRCDADRGGRRPGRRARARLRRRRAQHPRRAHRPPAQPPAAAGHPALQPQARPASGGAARPGRRGRRPGLDAGRDWTPPPPSCPTPTPPRPRSRPPRSPAPARSIQADGLLLRAVERTPLRPGRSRRPGLCTLALLSPPPATRRARRARTAAATRAATAARRGRGRRRHGPRHGRPGGRLPCGARPVPPPDGRPGRAARLALLAAAAAGRRWGSRRPCVALAVASGSPPGKTRCTPPI